MTDSEILRFIPSDDFIMPDGTLLDPSAFVAEVHRAKADGYYAFDSITDTFTHCFAVPVYPQDGTCIATLCLVAPRDDALANRASYLGALQKAASGLSARMGFEESGEFRSFGVRG